jgi:hypothetical protein
MSHFVLGYIDPGTGSLLLQSVVGGSLAVAYAGRKFVANAVGGFRNFIGRGPKTSSDVINKQ